MKKKAEKVSKLIAMLKKVPQDRYKEEEYYRICSQKIIEIINQHPVEIEQDPSDSFSRVYRYKKESENNILRILQAKRKELIQFKLPEEAVIAFDMAQDKCLKKYGISISRAKVAVEESPKERKVRPERTDWIPFTGPILRFRNLRELSSSSFEDESSSVPEQKNCVQSIEEQSGIPAATPLAKDELEKTPSWIKTEGRIATCKWIAYRSKTASTISDVTLYCERESMSISIEIANNTQKTLQFLQEKGYLSIAGLPLLLQRFSLELQNLEHLTSFLDAIATIEDSAKSLQAEIMDIADPYLARRKNIPLLDGWIKSGGRPPDLKALDCMSVQNIDLVSYERQSKYPGPIQKITLILNKDLSSELRILADDAGPNIANLLIKKYQFPRSSIGFSSIGFSHFNLPISGEKPLDQVLKILAEIDPIIANLVPDMLKVYNDFFFPV